MNHNQRTNGFLQTWLEHQKALAASISGEAGIPLQANGTLESAAFPAGRIDEVSQLWQKAMASWTALVRHGNLGAEGMKLHADLLKLAIDPDAWAKLGACGFDMALERITEGPAYATLWSLDRKFAQSQKLWNARAQAMAEYQALIRKAWNDAFERFANDIARTDAAPITSGRELLDTWIAIANETLLEAHRSREFLEAQRRLTRAATDYQLHEREITEMFCEMHHLPTLTELEEVQRITCELRREIRVLKRKCDEHFRAAATVKRSAASQKPPKTPGSRAAASVETTVRPKGVI